MCDLRAVAKISARRSQRAAPNLSLAAMKSATSIFAALTFSLLASACGGGEYVKKSEEFAEKACACKDAKCATEVTKEQADWLSKNAETASKLSSGDAEKVAAAATKMGECVTKLATAGM